MRVLIFLSAGLLIGIVLGFVTANKTFKAELEALVLSSNPGLPTAQANSRFKSVNSIGETNNPEKLSSQEIALAIAQADSKPDDLKLQESLGLALYQYSIIEQKRDILPDIEKLLERVKNGQTKPQVEVLMTLGNVYLGQSRENFDKKKNLSARNCYLQALQLQAQNKEAYLNLGLTYFYDQPINTKLAEGYYRKALSIDDSDQNALENLIAVYLATKNETELQKTVQHLRKLNPKHPSLTDLEIQLAQDELK